MSAVNRLVGPAPAKEGPPGQAEPQAAPEAGDEEFSRLRGLLLGGEIAGLKDLRQRLDDAKSRAEAVGQVVTEAIVQRNKRDRSLETVLGPTVEHIFRASVRRNPAELADSLFPAIGPAIRRSIAESIKGMFQDFSRALEMSLSLKGLSWRLEAWRTGRSFSEVVLLNTLEYQVEQLFLVKSDSGELLDHLAAEGAPTNDGEQVAAMFTAVQQFVNDSFAQGGLNTLEFGDVNVFVAHSAPAYIACVVRGQVPSQLRLELQKALEMLVMEYGDEIENFNGDSLALRPARHYVEGLMTAKYKAAARTPPLWAKLPPYFLAAAMLGSAALFFYKDVQMERLAERVYSEAAGPGFVPVRVEPHHFKKWKIVYLRDDLSDDPVSALTPLGLDPGRLDLLLLPYISQDPDIVVRRAMKILGERSGDLSFDFNDENNTLTLSGTAPLLWLPFAYERLLTVPGIEAVTVDSVNDPAAKVKATITGAGSVIFEGEASGQWIASAKRAAAGFAAADFSRLRDPAAEALAAGRAAAEAEIKRLAGRINSAVILFPVNGAAPIPTDAPKLQAAVDDLAALEKLAAELSLSVSLGIYGHADATGPARRNYELSQERAKTLAAMLYAKGSRIPINSYGLGADFAARGGAENPATDQGSRKIELRVNVSPTETTEP